MESILIKAGQDKAVSLAAEEAEQLAEQLVQELEAKHQEREARSREATEGTEAAPTEACNKIEGTNLQLLDVL